MRCSRYNLSEPLNCWPSRKGRAAAAAPPRRCVNSARIPRIRARCSSSKGSTVRTLKKSTPARTHTSRAPALRAAPLLYRAARLFLLSAFLAAARFASASAFPAHLRGIPLLTLLLALFTFLALCFSFLPPAAAACTATKPPTAAYRFTLPAASYESSISFGGPPRASFARALATARALSRLRSRALALARPLRPVSRAPRARLPRARRLLLLHSPPHSLSLPARLPRTTYLAPPAYLPA